MYWYDCRLQEQLNVDSKKANISLINSIEINKFIRNITDMHQTIQKMSDIFKLMKIKKKRVILLQIETASNTASKSLSYFPIHQANVTFKWYIINFNGSQ